MPASQSLSLIPTVQPRMEGDFDAFLESLDDLWRRRRAELSAIVKTGRGRPPNSLERDERNRLIADVVERAEEALLPFAKAKFIELRFGRSYRHALPNLGRAPLSHSNADPFLQRVSRSVESPYIVYIFWKGGRCLYIGQSSNGVKGGGGLWKEYYWREGTHIEIASSKDYRGLSALECLAGHIFDPKHNIYKPPQHPYGTPCPVHQRLDNLKEELRYTFSLRG